MAKKNGKRLSGNTIQWILSIFMFTACLTYGFTLASVIFALLGVCLLPIASVRDIKDKFLPKRKALRGIIAFAIFLVACFLTPQVETDTPAPTNPTNTTISSNATNGATSTSTKPATTPSTKPSENNTTNPATKPSEGTPEVPESSSFEVHFIDVGQADAALVLCDGKAMLIDGGNADDSNLIYTYLKKHNISHLDYVIGTHGHEDHIGGLSGALQYATVDVAYCPVTSYDSKAFRNFVGALDKRGVSITVPSKGDSFTLGSATCSVLAVNTDKGDPNNTSIVLRIVYGETSFLFTGDAERVVEQDILNGNADIQSTVLKVGHHGSDSSTSYLWLREVAPEYAVISVGKGNSYGHPTEEVLSRLRDAEVKTFRTDMQGDIICVSDGKNVTFTVARNPNADVFEGIGNNSTQQPDPTEPSEPEDTKDNGRDYVVNKSTKKFHLPSCSSAESIKESNRWEYHGTREELIDMGYEPCKRCHP